jgi:hypothetical protein
MTLKAVQFGCGPIGCSIVRVASKKKNFEIVGALDLANVGRDLGEVAGLGKKLGVIISDDASKILNEAKPGVVLHATGSNLENIFPQLEKIIESGCNIVSTCEELSYPYRRYPELSDKLDKLAKKHGVTVLGTGVNPGFLMDTWPLFMTAVCQNVKQVKAVRIQDASSRRIPFQKKIGAGKTTEEFSKLIEAGTLRHVGLPESIAMIAAGVEWELDDITETIEPVMLETEVRSDYITVRPGQVAGVKQIAYGWKDGQKLITLDFRAYIGAKESYDAVYITGTPNMEVTVKGGTHGDIATGAIVVNSVTRVMDAPPGLITMKDLPVVCALPTY